MASPPRVIARFPLPLSALSGKHTYPMAGKNGDFKGMKELYGNYMWLWKLWKGCAGHCPVSGVFAET